MKPLRTDRTLFGQNTIYLIHLNMDKQSDDPDGIDQEGLECEEAGAHCVVLRPMPAVSERCATEKGGGSYLPRPYLVDALYARMSKLWALTWTLCAADALTTAGFPLLPHETAKHRARRVKAFEQCWLGLSSHMQAHSHSHLPGQPAFVQAWQAGRHSYIGRPMVMHS